MGTKKLCKLILEFKVSTWLIEIIDGFSSNSIQINMCITCHKVEAMLTGLQDFPLTISS